MNARQPFLFRSPLRQQRGGLPSNPGQTPRFNTTTYRRGLFTGPRRS